MDRLQSMETLKQNLHHDATYYLLQHLLINIKRDSSIDA